MTTVSAFVIKDIVQQQRHLSNIAPSSILVPCNGINNKNRILRCYSLLIPSNRVSTNLSKTRYWYLQSMFNENNDIDNNIILPTDSGRPLPSSSSTATATATATPMKTAQSDDENILHYSDVLPQPNPSYTAMDVVMACMETIVQNQLYDINIGLQVCYNFSNDRCRSAIGGNINEFYLYAQNPIFQHITYCTSYSIISIGPILSGTHHRGSMQTILMDVQSSKSNHNLKPSISFSSTINTKTTNNNDTTLQQQQQVEEKSYRFLWTLQQERRPPYQNCWLIHEVLYTKNAYHHTI